MGFFKKPKLKDPVDPVLLKEEIVPTNVPNIGVLGGFSGIKNSPEAGTNVGVWNLDSIKDIANQAQGQLRNILPDVGSLSAEDMASGLAFADLMFNKGKSDIDSNLYNNIKNLREDSFRRGLGASSSFLSGMGKLYGSNASALGDLRNDSFMQGLNYASNLANMRNQGANLLNNISGDTFFQSTQFPINAGMKFAIPQAQLWENNKKLNLGRLGDYYGISNNAITNYNKSLNTRDKNQKDFWGGLANTAGDLITAPLKRNF